MHQQVQTTITKCVSVLCHNVCCFTSFVFVFQSPGYGIHVRAYNENAHYTLTTVHMLQKQVCILLKASALQVCKFASPNLHVCSI